MDLFDNLPRSGRAHGVHGNGSRSFDPDQRRAVVQALLAASGPLSVEELADLTGVPGRSVRAIVSAADGESFVLGGDMRGGYVVAATLEDAERLSRRLGSQIREMARRLARRRGLARRTFGPKVQ